LEPGNVVVWEEKIREKKWEKRGVKNARKEKNSPSIKFYEEEFSVLEIRT